LTAANQLLQIPNYGAPGNPELAGEGRNVRSLERVPDLTQDLVLAAETIRRTAQKLQAIDPV
jgi:hypothetical protein